MTRTETQTLPHFPTAPRAPSGAPPDEATVLLDLQTQIRLQSDALGEDILGVGVAWSGKIVRFEFPRFGVWDQFLRDIWLVAASHRQGIAALMARFRELDAHVDTDWVTAAQLAFRSPDLANKIEHIFFKYLKPNIAGVWFPRRWLRKHTPIDGVIRLFFALVSIDDWYQKKTLQLLMKIYPASATPKSTVTSEKSGEWNQHLQPNEVPDQFVRF